MADISTANLDSDSDSPKLARIELLALVNRVNDYADEFTTPILSAGNGSRNQNNASGDPAHIWEVTNDASAYQVLRVNSYGISAYGNNMHWCRYNGTLAAPTAIGSGSYLMSMGFRGWDGSGALSQSAAAFQCLTTEAWSSTAHGIKFNFEVSKATTTSRLPALQIYAGVSDGAILQVGDGTSLLSRIINNSTGGALQVHGDSGQNGAQSIWYGSAHATAPYESLHRANAHRFESVGGTEFGRLDTSGNLQLGMTGGSARINAQGAGSAVVAQLRNAAGNGMLYTGTANLTTATGENAANAMLYLRKDSTTNRSINAAGTINASGADYAERMPVAPGCGPVEPGQVVGIAAGGMVTDRWPDAVHFLIVSTDPSFVGNDIFGSADGAVLLAFAGQVPCDVEAAPGDYIVPVQAGDGIGLLAVAEPTLAQYMAAVGRVIAINQAGRPVVVVKSC